jgi:hypothetical protein
MNMSVILMIIGFIILSIGTVALNIDFGMPQMAALAVSVVGAVLLIIGFMLPSGKKAPPPRPPAPKGKSKFTEMGELDDYEEEEEEEEGQSNFTEMGELDDDEEEEEEED